MRKNIFEILKERYDVNNEFKKITGLFNSEFIQRKFHQFTGTYTNYYTLEEMVEDVFCDWKGRGSCISWQNMREELGINKIINDTKCTIDDIIVALEYYENISNLFFKKVAPGLPTHEYTIHHNLDMLYENMDKLLDYLNYERRVFDKEEMVILIPKNPAATAVAEISSEETAMAILMYHHASLKGQLEEKRKLLLTIAREYEPLLKKGIDGFSSYFDNARNMLNSVHLRHNNKEGKDKIEKIAKMTNKELENWYDELYQLLLFCVLIKDNKERQDKMAEFLKGLKEKK